MSVMTEQEAEMFLSCVVDALVKYHQMSENDADKIVHVSSLADTIKIYPQEVISLSVRYWAQEVIEEFEKLENIKNDDNQDSR